MKKLIGTAYVEALLNADLDSMDEVRRDFLENVNTSEYPDDKTLIIKLECSNLINQFLKNENRDYSHHLKYLFENLTGNASINHFVSILRTYDNPQIERALILLGHDSFNTLSIDEKYYSLEYIKMLGRIVQNTNIIVVFKNRSPLLTFKYKPKFIVPIIKQHLGFNAVLSINGIEKTSIFETMLDTLTDEDKSKIRQNLHDRPMMWHTMLPERDYYVDNMLHDYNLLFDDNK